MRKISKVGRNIESLAKAINESSTAVAEKLGISSGHLADIRNNKTNPKRETLEKFAIYFGVSAEALMNDDFSGLNLLADPARFGKNIYNLLPLEVSDEALQNPRFAKAYAAQRRVYDAEKEMKPIKSMEEKKKLFDDILNYFEVDESEKVFKESIINGISFCFYSLLCLKTTEIISSYTYHEELYPAMLEKMKENNSEFREMIESIEFDDNLEDGTPFQDAIHDNEFTEIIDDLLLGLKTMEGRRDLAEYYLSLLYVFGVTDNNFSFEQNHEFGIDLMARYAALGNEYANNYIDAMNLSTSEY